MHVRFLAVLGVSAGALALASTVTGAANAHTVGVAPSHHGVMAQHVAPMKRGNCYSNMMNDGSDAIVSQNFTDAGFDAYDSQGADNFAVKKTCKVTGIDVMGQYFNGTGPADSETVTFYADDADGVPGTVLDSQTVTGADSAGSFTIPLSTVTLTPGSYWVSVQATMAFSSGGEWGWEVTTNQKQGVDGQWENPADGFGTGCTTWGDVVTCVAATGPDYMFTLTK